MKDTQEYTNLKSFLQVSQDTEFYKVYGTWCSASSTIASIEKSKLGETGFDQKVAKTMREIAANNIKCSENMLDLQIEEFNKLDLAFKSSQRS